MPLYIFDDETNRLLSLIQVSSREEAIKRRRFSKEVHPKSWAILGEVLED